MWWYFKDMLSKCAPFTSRKQFAEGILGVPISVFAVILTTTSEIITVELTETDTQSYTTAKGIVTILHSQNISDLFQNFRSLFPGLSIRAIEVHVETPSKKLSSAIPCPPLNPEMVATTARRLIKELYVP